MRFPINDETEIIVKFGSRKQHERFCHETGAGSRFIYRVTDSGRVEVVPVGQDASIYQAAPRTSLLDLWEAKL